MRKKWKAASATVGIAAVAIGIWFVLRPGRRFDQAVWSNSATPVSVRLRMADDLVDHRKLIGLTRQQVVARLG